jgi:hypothetical protein
MQYKVSGWETVYASTYLEADSEEEAIAKFQRILEDDGMPADAESFNREYRAESATKIGE